MFLAETAAGINILNGWLKNLGDYALHAVLPALILFVIGAAIIRAVMVLVKKSWKSLIWKRLPTA